MSRSHFKPLSQRQLRVGELIRKELSDIFLRESLHDAALSGVYFTVNQVRMSPDLKLATAYISALNATPDEIDHIVKSLKDHAKNMRGLLGQRLTMKFTPEIRFKADHMLDEAEKIERLLASDKVRQDVTKSLDEGE